jgi:hypothetical protein
MFFFIIGIYKVRLFLIFICLLVLGTKGEEVGMEWACSSGGKDKHTKFLRKHDEL